MSFFQELPDLFLFEVAKQLDEETFFSFLLTNKNTYRNSLPFLKKNQKLKRKREIYIQIFDFMKTIFKFHTFCEVANSVKPLLNKINIDIRNSILDEALPYVYLCFPLSIDSEELKIFKYLYKKYFPTEMNYDDDDTLVKFGKNLVLFMR